MSSDVREVCESYADLTRSERRSTHRHACTRLVVVRLPGPDGCWRWYWVADICPGGLAVSFLVQPAPQGMLETVLLDVDRALSFPVSLQFIWHQEEIPTRTGFAFARADLRLLKWIAGIGKRRRPRARHAEGRSLWESEEP